MKTLDPVPEDDSLLDDEAYEPSEGLISAGMKRFFAVLGMIIAVGFMMAVGFELGYAGKIYPGVIASGVNVGGMTRDKAIEAVKRQSSAYTQGQLPVQYDSTTLRIDLDKLGLTYDPEATVDAAYQYGRQGNLLYQIRQHAKAAVRRPASFSVYQFNDTKLTPYISQISEDVTKPVANASLSLENNTSTVIPSQTGIRLDTGRLVQLIAAQLGATSDSTVTAPTYDLAPLITTEDINRVKDDAKVYLAGPVTLKVDDQAILVDLPQIVQWIGLSRSTPRTFDQTGQLADLYPSISEVKVGIREDKIRAFVADLAAKTDQQGQNAQLSIQDGKAVVFQASRNGRFLDQDGAINAIKDSLTQGPDNRTLTLNVQSVKPEVNEESLNDLGIKELISEGETLFPGSPSTRLTNIRVGAARFNGALLKPDETFSFGAILGDVGPEQGYVPELVILQNHEEKQYGGGLCQVASTAYRAALNAGLPIVERHNHSFAVSYYTAPFGVPGVDATIYYPQVDLKFKNDTGSYILIQTIMEGTTLKFQFYGTKTKQGVIRGPEFVSGTTDAKQPSHTVFYRDVEDLAGNVIKTDTINTWYKPSTDFPITKQFN